MNMKKKSGKKTVCAKTIKLTKLQGIVIKEKPNNIILSELNTEIKKIYHISDIHISRFDDRHPEYLQVFKNLSNELKKDPDDALVVICGDITHEKNAMSPPQVMLIKQFFCMISDIMPCVCIIGNHDISPQLNCIDALTPILTNLNTKYPIHLLLDDKTYLYNNIMFGHTSMWSKQVTPCTARDKIKIGLYHGTLHGSTTDDDYDLSSRAHFNATDFTKHYDYVMLGDVHRFMYLDKQKRCAYSGSLLQTRFGESLEKGMIKWDLVKQSSEFVRISNDHGFVKMRVGRNGIDPMDLANMPKYPIVRMEYEDMLSSKAEEFATILREQYNATCSVIDVEDKKVNITIGKGKDSKKVVDIKCDKTVYDLISDYMTTQRQYDKDTNDAVCNKISEILRSLKYNYCTDKKDFVLKKMSFDNFFNYGAKNVIDYTKMNGIIGVNGASHTGKSASIDAMLYSIFGQCSRGDKYDVINVNKKTMHTSVEFDIDVDHGNKTSYRITRDRRILGTRDSTETVILHRGDANISKDTVDKTNAEIVKLLCGYDDFVNISIMLQQKNKSFIDLTDKEKKGLICGLLKLDVFSDILSEARTRICQINYYLSNVRKNIGTSNKKKSFDKNEKVNDITHNIKSIQSEYDEMTVRMNEYARINESNMCAINEYNYRMKEYVELKILDGNNDATQINKNIVKITKKIEAINLELKQFEDENKSLNKTLILRRNAKKKIDTCMKKYKNINHLYDKFKTDQKQRIDALNGQNEKLLRSRIPCDDFNASEHKKLHMDECRTNKLISANIKRVRDNIRKWEKKIVDNQMINNLESLYTELKNAQNQKATKTLELEQNLNITNDLRSKLNKLKDHHFDPKCEYCMGYSVTQEKIRYEKDIVICNDNAKNLNSSIIGLDIIIKKLNKYESMYDTYIKNKKLNNESEEEINKLKQEAMMLEKDLKISDSEVQKFVKLQLIVQQAKAIDNECDTIKTQIDAITKESCVEYLEYIELNEQMNRTDNDIKQIKNDNLYLAKM